MGFPGVARGIVVPHADIRIVCTANNEETRKDRQQRAMRQRSRRYGTVHVKSPATH